MGMPWWCALLTVAGGGSDARAGTMWELAGHRRDDAVGGVGQVGEAVGQAGAGEDEAVGVFVLGDAELGQQVQMVAQGLEFGVGVGGQVVAGIGERSVRHGGVLPCGARRACGRALRPQGVGRFEAGNRQPGVFPLWVLY